MEQLSLNLSDSLFDEITSLDQLRAAYKVVRANRGVPGIDAVSLETFGENLEEELRTLQKEAREWNYKPNPVKRVRIPKPGSNKVRMLGVPCVRDRVFQYSIKRSLEGRFEDKFSDNSYGFRPGRSQKDAVEQARKWVEEGRDWVVDLDLENFFDRINHDRIIHLLKEEVEDQRVLRLIGMTLRSGVMDGEHYEASREGAVQGSPLSPLLSNVILHELDMELEKRGLAFCRYADDSNIFVRSEKAAMRVKESITRFIESHLKLKVNREKSRVSPCDRVKFLGKTIACGLLVISTVSLKRALEKVKELTPRGSHYPLEKQIERINLWYVGWSGYYKMTELPSQLQGIEAHLRARLRAWQMRSSKRRKNLHRKLCKQGIRSHTASKVVYSNDGIRRMSHTFASNLGWDKRWIKSRGLKRISGDGLSHWHPLEKWMKLT